MTPKEARRKAKALKDRADYYARRREKMRAAERAAADAREQVTLREERSRLAAEEQRILRETMREAARQWNEAYSRSQIERGERLREAAKTAVRHESCADDGVHNGCYMFAEDGTPWRDECRAACKELRPKPRLQRGGGLALLLPLLLALPKEER